MALLINPGSQIGPGTSGWSNSHETAKRYAYEWFFKPMTEQGFADIEVRDTGEERAGRWVFEFTHTVTGVTIELETHGIDDLDAYQRDYIFDPRVYWNGSSGSNPSIEDFKASGFEPLLTYRPSPGAKS